MISKELLEAPIGFEPMHKGFADLSLSHLGTAPRKAAQSNILSARFLIIQEISVIWHSRIREVVRLWRTDA